MLQVSCPVYNNAYLTWVEYGIDFDADKTFLDPICMGMWEKSSIKYINFWFLFENIWAQLFKTLLA